MRHRAPLFGLLAVMVLAVAYYFLAFDPLTEEREGLEAETAELETRAAQLQSEIAELRRVEEDQLEIQAELALMEEYIPNDVAQPTALREFQATADQAGVEIDNVGFGEPVAVEDAPSTGEEGTTLAEISLSMSIKGGYFQLVDLLRRLEVDVPRALLVDSVAIAEGDDGFPELATQWSGRIFAVVDVAATAEADEGDPAEADAEDAGADGEGDPAAEGGAEADTEAGAEAGVEAGTEPGVEAGTEEEDAQ